MFLPPVSMFVNLYMGLWWKLREMQKLYLSYWINI